MDLIERQDVLSICQETYWNGADDYYPISASGIAKKVKELPSAQQEQRWIPCSEKLPDHPENNDYYLVTIQCEHYDGWDDYVTGFAEWTKHGWDEVSCYIGQIKVVAWMPLPQPYKAESEDK